MSTWRQLLLLEAIVACGRLRATGSSTVDVLFDDQVARIALEEHLHEALARLGEATHQSPGDGFRIIE